MWWLWHQRLVDKFLSGASDSLGAQWRFMQLRSGLLHLLHLLSRA